jgi:hypothetical protein
VLYGIVLAPPDRTLRATAPVADAKQAVYTGGAGSTKEGASRAPFQVRGLSLAPLRRPEVRPARGPHLLAATALGLSGGLVAGRRNRLGSRSGDRRPGRPDRVARPRLSRPTMRLIALVALLRPLPVAPDCPADYQVPDTGHDGDDR